MYQETASLNQSTPETGSRWAEGAIVYQIYPRSFKDSNSDGIGDLPGITEKLDHVKEVANAIWLSPFYTSPMADFGYDVADYCDVDPIFGTVDDARELIEQAHGRDLKIIVDLVPNHSSDEHDWFLQSSASKDGPYSDWYIWKDAAGTDKDNNPLPPNNWIEVFSGESAWEWNETRQQFYMHSFNVHQPDLNWSNPEVREAIKSAMRFWIDLGVDGFRVDAVNFTAKDAKFQDDPVNPDYDPEVDDHRYSRLIHDFSQGMPHLYSYLSEMASVLKEDQYADRDLFMTTEGYPTGPDHTKEYLQYYMGMDPDVAAPFNFEGLSLPWEAKPWAEYLKEFHTAIDDFSDKCVPSYAFGNHDRPRIASRLGEERARSAAALLLTLPGMVFIYNGDEIGMHDGEIPEEYIQDPGANGSVGRDPVRTPMQWSDAYNAGFTDGDSTWLPINPDYIERNVETEKANPGSFLNLYKKLCRLRNETSAIKNGEFAVLESGNPDVLAYSRSNDDETYTVFVNFSNKQIELDQKDNVGELVLSTNSEQKFEDTARGRVTLIPNEVVVIKSN